MSLLLFGFVIVTYLAHLVIANIYNRWFPSAKTTKFRAFHAAETFVVTTIMMIAFGQATDSQISTISVVAQVLGTLVILDAILFYSSTDLRKRFDVFHIGMAYIAVTTAIIIFNT